MAVLGIPTLLFILYVLAFVVGLVFIPLFAWTIGPSLGFVAEGLANLLWIVSMVGVRRGILVQKETNEYEIKRGDASLTPRSYWTRWALAPFGITFEPTEQAFDSALVDDDMIQELDNLSYDKDGTATVDMDRGGESWYVHKDDRDGILVPIGQKLAQLKNAAGPELGLEAYTAALEEFGGDTAGSSNRTRLIGSVLFTSMGIGVGWVLFI